MVTFIDHLLLPEICKSQKQIYKIRLYWKRQRATYIQVVGSGWIGAGYMRGWLHSRMKKYPGSTLLEDSFDLTLTLRWRHNEHDGVLNHQPHDCLFNRLFRRRSQKTSKLRVTGLCEGNSPVTGEFLAQRASNEEVFLHLMTSSWSDGEHPKVFFD